MSDGVTTEVTASEMEAVKALVEKLIDRLDACERMAAEMASGLAEVHQMLAERDNGDEIAVKIVQSLNRAFALYRVPPENA